MPTAVITGGEGDLATAIRAALESSGYDVLAPGKATLDVTDSASVTSFFASVPEVSFLVNQAGIVRDALTPRLAESEWDAVVDVSLKGAFLCSRAVLKPMMKARAGHILNVSSFSALRPPIGQANYAAAKAGLLGLTQSLAAEVGKRNIRVNAVLPGFLETKMTAPLSDEVRETARAAHTLGRFNTPEDAAKFIAFLDTMEHVSGQVFQLDSRIARW